MDIVLPFIVVKVFAGAVITAAFAFLAFREKETYLIRWTLGWLFFFSWGLLDLLHIYFNYPALLFFSRLLLLIGGFFLLEGTLYFLNVTIRRFWPAAAVITVLFALEAAVFGFTYVPVTVPVFFFNALIFTATGYAFFKTRLLRGVSKVIIGVVLVIWGLQIFAAAVFILLVGRGDWFYLSTGFYIIIIALFMVISYFDRVRSLREESEARYRSLFHENRAVMFIIDPENMKILDMNRAALDFYGYERDKLADLSVFDISYLDKREVKDRINKIISSRTRRFESVHKTADGSDREVEVLSGTIVLDGRTVLSSIVFDITERKKTERQMESAKDELEKANAVKQEFMANMSHELRTPLNGILGMASLLKASDLTEEQHNYLDMINVSGENLYRVISDILNFSDIVSKEFELEFSKFNLREHLEGILNRFRVEAAAKDLDMRFQYGAGVPRKVSSDKLRLSQIFVNLISNAIKFTETGWVKVLVDCDGPMTVITVADSGVGIEKSSLDAIFGMFTLGVSTYTKRYAGAGIGLAIVKELVDKLGGSISVESSPGEGSEFTVRLPLQVVEEEPETPAQAVGGTEEGFEAENLRILVAEDEVINRMYIEEFLRLHKAEVVSVRTGEDALAKALAEHFDLILMDISMPKMNGLEAAEQIRSMEKVRIPIIALTAYTYPEDIKRCMDAGMDDFIAKPVDEKRLIEMVRKFRT